MSMDNIEVSRGNLIAFRAARKIVPGVRSKVIIVTFRDWVYIGKNKTLRAWGGQQVGFKGDLEDIVGNRPTVFEIQGDELIVYFTD